MQPNRLLRPSPMMREFLAGCASGLGLGLLIMASLAILGLDLTRLRAWLGVLAGAIGLVLLGKWIRPPEDLSDPAMRLPRLHHGRIIVMLLVAVFSGIIAAVVAYLVAWLGHD